MAVPSSDPARRTQSWGRRILPAVLALLVLWLAAGFLRASSVAVDYVVRTESPKGVSDLTTTLAPGIPPFWVVTVRSTVRESTGAHYASSEILWVEPLSGWVLVLARG